jgi:hypothetical protein
MIHMYDFGTLSLRARNQDKSFNFIEIVPMRHLAQCLLFPAASIGSGTIRFRP